MVTELTNENSKDIVSATKRQRPNNNFHYPAKFKSKSGKRKPVNKVGEKNTSVSSDKKKRRHKSSQRKRSNNRGRKMKSNEISIS